MWMRGIQFMNEQSQRLVYRRFKIYQVEAISETQLADGQKPCERRILYVYAIVWRCGCV